MYAKFLLVLSLALASHALNLKVGIAQIFVLDSDLSGNLVRIENAIREAKSLGAELVAFPECSLLGWVNPDAWKLASPIPGSNSNALVKLAIKYNFYLVIGLAEHEGNNLYDSAVLISSSGDILLKHRKINILTNLMNPPYTPGNSVLVTTTPWGTFGLLICADTFLTDVVNKMAALKPDIVFVPYGWAANVTDWPQHEKDLEDVVTRTAKVIQAPIVGVDVVGMISHGPWTMQTYGGASVVADRNGSTIVICADRDRDVRVVEIQL